jgi:2-hydroxycyclohexanecarboxyl-CoA dehydrogenase
MTTAKRVALVTGGASGIGRSICLRLARDGVAVAALDLNHPAAEATAAAIVAAGGQAMAVVADVADATAVRAAVDRVHAGLGPVHVMVNVAGIGAFVPLIDMTDDEWNRMIAVHLTGTFNCTRAVLPDMLATGWGRIVNTASVAGLNGGGPGLSHYAAAKGGIIAFSKALAHELGPSGITVNCLAPGLVDTPLIRSSLVTAELRARAVEGAPVRRIGTPDDIAAACAFLVSDESSFCTGQVISPNGGRYM